MLASVINETSWSVGVKTFQYAPMFTLNKIVRELKVRPDLIKIDVEGYEYQVFIGGKHLLRKSSEQRPALCLEINPKMLKKHDSSVEKISRMLVDYEFFYINDYSGQKTAPGEPIGKLADIDWVANVFALPGEDPRKITWQAEFRHLIQQYLKP
ncbi:MAG: hypothetical protein D6732_05695 [Methanobacteriota archaeon]|nr:MAG: hypothetical protein D6732_05695 [Euryarchaeota archaeon]